MVKAVPISNLQPAIAPLAAQLHELHLADEEALLRRLLLHPAARLPFAQEITPLAAELMQAIRGAPPSIRIETLLTRNHQCLSTS